MQISGAFTALADVLMVSNFVSLVHLPLITLGRTLSTMQNVQEDSPWFSTIRDEATRGYKQIRACVTVATR